MNSCCETVLKALKEQKKQLENTLMEFELTIEQIEDGYCEGGFCTERFVSLAQKVAGGENAKN